MKFTIKTIGCKVNTYESEKIKDELIKLGFIYVDLDNIETCGDIDFYIINTCSVTSIADKKSRQMVHKAKVFNPKAKVIAIGCSEVKDADLYVSNKEKMLLPGILKEKYLDANNKVNRIEFCNTANRLTANRIRSFIKIQDGCNQYCTYCIIPFLRGNIKSRDNKEVIEEIKEKLLNGTKEIVLTGIHLSSFGLDRLDMSYESDGAIEIARENLLKMIDDILDISIEKDEKKLVVERIRLGSLEPRIISEDFIKHLLKDRIKDVFCANFCLSLQSGSDKILKAMNRHYNIKDFENACTIIRKHMPNATITTDIIVGFPGETEEDFNESLEFVKKMRFYNPNIFPYSRRKGTKADTFDNQLTNKVKHERAVKMIAECGKITREIELNYNKSEHEILVEEIVDIGGERYGIGYSKEYIRGKVRI